MSKRQKVKYNLQSPPAGGLFPKTTLVQEYPNSNYKFALSCPETGSSLVWGYTGTSVTISLLLPNNNSIILPYLDRTKANTGNLPRVVLFRHGIFAVDLNGSIAYLTIYDPVWNYIKGSSLKGIGPDGSIWFENKKHNIITKVTETFVIEDNSDLIPQNPDYTLIEPNYYPDYVRDNGEVLKRESYVVRVISSNTYYSSRLIDPNGNVARESQIFRDIQPTIDSTYSVFKIGDFIVASRASMTYIFDALTLELIKSFNPATGAVLNTGYMESGKIILQGYKNTSTDFYAVVFDPNNLNNILTFNSSYNNLNITFGSSHSFYIVPKMNAVIIAYYGESLITLSRLAYFDLPSLKWKIVDVSQTVTVHNNVRVSLYQEKYYLLYLDYNTNKLVLTTHNKLTNTTETVESDIKLSIVLPKTVLVSNNQLYLSTSLKSVYLRSGLLNLSNVLIKMECLTGVTEILRRGDLISFEYLTDTNNPLTSSIKPFSDIMALMPSDIVTYEGFKYLTSTTYDISTGVSYIALKKYDLNGNFVSNTNIATGTYTSAWGIRAKDGTPRLFFQSDYYIRIHDLSTGVTTEAGATSQHTAGVHCKTDGTPLVIAGSPETKVPLTKIPETGEYIGHVIGGEYKYSRISSDFSTILETGRTPTLGPLYKHPEGFYYSLASKGTVLGDFSLATTVSGPFTSAGFNYVEPMGNGSMVTSPANSSLLSIRSYVGGVSTEITRIPYTALPTKSDITYVTDGGKAVTTTDYRQATGTISGQLWYTDGSESKKISFLAKDQAYRYTSLKYLQHVAVTNTGNIIEVGPTTIRTTLLNGTVLNYKIPDRSIALSSDAQRNYVEIADDGEILVSIFYLTAVMPVAGGGVISQVFSSTDDGNTWNYVPVEQRGSDTLHNHAARYTTKINGFYYSFGPVAGTTRFSDTLTGLATASTSSISTCGYENFKSKVTPDVFYTITQTGSQKVTKPFTLTSQGTVSSTSYFGTSTIFYSTGVTGTDDRLYAWTPTTTRFQTTTIRMSPNIGAGNGTWSTRRTIANTFFSPSNYNHNNFIGLDSSGKIVKYDPNTDTLTTIPMSGHSLDYVNYTSIVVASPNEQYLVVCNDYGYVYLINTNDGTLVSKYRYRFDMYERMINAVGIDDNFCYVLLGNVINRAPLNQAEDLSSYSYFATVPIGTPLDSSLYCKNNRVICGKYVFDQSGNIVQILYSNQASLVFQTQTGTSMQNLEFIN